MVNIATGETNTASGLVAAFNPLYSPDGKKLAFLKVDDGPSSHRILRTHILDIASGGIIPFANTPDQMPYLLSWTSDSSGVFFAETHRTLSTFGIVREGGVKRLDIGERLISSVHLIPVGHPVDISRDGTRAALVLEKSNQPPEIYVHSLGEGQPNPVSEINAAVVKEGYPSSQTVEWQNSEGDMIEGLLTLPLGHVPGTPLPVLTFVHGGPPNVSQDVFLSAPHIFPRGALLEKGIAIFSPNFTGSLGYGGAFRRHLAGALGQRDIDDVLTGVQHLVDTGIADPEKLAIGGWSYGGYVSSMAIRRSDRFLAASIGAGPSNLVSYIATSDFSQLFEDYFAGARPWQAVEAFSEASPVAHPAAGKLKVLIQHGESDQRVPFSQAIENLYSLKTSGADVRLSVFPGRGHVLFTPADLRVSSCENYILFTSVLLAENSTGDAMNCGK
ncbi:S9 family peptidase [Kordiimonas gwangyangensis]|nr:prolyl oligopeptidase family serine peptidase [Kordiimonas gwangyangensis]